MLSRMAVKVVSIGKGLIAASTPATKVRHQENLKLFLQRIIGDMNMRRSDFSILMQDYKCCTKSLVSFESFS